ncbi:MAG: biopolymer transporter ExbD [Pseudobdellovibrio sp.]|jgi:biopolymer transport protein ExbD|nr:biopolymer transporter ExbD [Pseudobdellovibrio sp.]
MARTRFKIDTKKNKSFGLNITSMTDMFTILLVFLLQNFAASEVQIDPVDKLRLPTSVSDRNPVDGIKISINQSELKIDQKTIAAVTNNEVDKSSLDPSDSNFIKPLFDELQKINAELVAKKDVKLGRILLQADQELPYSALRKVMYTASMAGFPNLKLVTTVGN